MDTKQLTQLAAWLKETDIVDFIYKKDGNNIEIKTADAPVQASKFDCNLIPVTSPAVGVFHTAEKGNSNTLKEGVPVEEGAVLGIVEMVSEKFEVKSPAKGILRVISIEEAKPVEYGQPLFFIEA
ncbi:MAG: hypothetical protein FWF35_02615 [Elusimicrobia bacterium]|nr:hypothetical protein [Elusimicrobiota bacterium]